MQDNTEPEGRGLKRQHEPSDDSEPLNKRFQATLNLDTDDTISEKVRCLFTSLFICRTDPCVLG